MDYIWERLSIMYYVYTYTTERGVSSNLLSKQVRPRPTFNKQGWSLVNPVLAYLSSSYITINQMEELFPFFINWW